MTSRDDIRKTLIEILEADMGENYSHVEDGMNLREQLGLDSVDVVSIVSQVERRFRIRMTHEELQTLSTVGDLLSLMQTKLASAPPESNAISTRCGGTSGRVECGNRTIGLPLPLSHKRPKTTIELPCLRENVARPDSTHKLHLPDLCDSEFSLRRARFR